MDGVCGRHRVRKSRNAAVKILQDRTKPACYSNIRPNMSTKELLEIIILVMGGGSAAATGAFAFALTRSRLELKDLKLNLKNEQLEFTENLYKSINFNQLEFARKVQQNIEANRVEVGIIKCDIKDIKGVLEREMNMRQRPSFPEENKPAQTDFT